MATVIKVKRLKELTRMLYNKKEMKAAQLQGQPSEKTKAEYYQAYDNFDDALSEYYAAKLMLLKSKGSDLFDLYLNMSKQEVKKRLLRKITKEAESKLAIQANLARITKLKEEIKSCKIPDKKKVLSKKLARLESWAKDINY